MKKIFPTTNNTILTSNEKSITQEQYDVLVDRVNDAEECAELASRKVDNLLSSQRNQISTNQLNASNATITGTAVTDTLITNRATSNTVESTVGNIASLTSDQLTASNATITAGIVSNLTSDNITANTIQSDEITSTEATIDKLTTNELSLQSVDAQSIEADSAAIHSAGIDTVISDCATIDNANISEASITEAEIETATITNSQTTNADLTYITHTYDPQEVVQVADSGDFYILFPIFTNGNYFVEARNDGGVKLWSVELLNSIKNVQFRWSERNLGHIIDLKFATDASGASVVQIHANALNEHVSLFRQSQSTDNTLPPIIYDTDQLPDEVEALVISELAGTYIQDVIFTNKLHVNCLEMDSLFMDCVGVFRELWLTYDFEQAGDLTRPLISCGEEGQYVINRAHCNIVHPSYESPSVRVDSTDNKLITSCAVAQYNGTEYAGTYECDEEDKIRNYPITQLGNNTCVHGNAEVKCNLKTDTLQSRFINDSKLEAYSNGLTNVIYEYDEENDAYSNLEATDTFYRAVDNRLDELAAYNSDCQWQDSIDPSTGDTISGADGKLLSYNATSNTIQPTDTAQLEDLEVDTLTVNCNAYVKGDLFVSGVTHTVEEETVSTSSDILVLRQNNDTPIAIGDASGLIINKYNGSDNLAIVVDQSGTLRVGDVSGTSSTPATVYLKAGKWYSDADCTTEIHPTGELTSYTNKEIIGDVTKYTNAVFTAFNYTNLSPLLGRDELADMTNNGLLYFDKASWEAHTLTIPTKNGVALKYKKENNVDVYYWEKAAGVYVFNTQADYLAASSDIEDGSIIEIVNEKSYVEAEIVA